MKIKYFTFFLFLSVLITLPAQAQQKNHYDSLLQLFKDWRQFEEPPLREGAPDYTLTTREGRWAEFKQLQNRLQAIDTAGWSVPYKVDWTIVWAEMNGYDFNHRVLKSWERDPAFYKSLWMARSDVPAHEGPTHHRTTELWTYEFPLSLSERKRLLGDLAVIPALNLQARENLTGNARELWIAGIRDIKNQVANLKWILDLPGVGEDAEIVAAVQKAVAATEDLAGWLEAQSPSKSGPSGIGKENYTWYLQNVHLVPLTWEDEVLLLKRELARAWASLKLEEHRNRNLPPLEAADSPEAYDALAETSARSLLTFLDKQDIVSVKEYFEPALRAHLGAFVPEDTRNFFWITAHYDPRPLYSH
ncbi:MAG: hypothetical protein P8X60_07925 [Robiginitalea sp.]